MVCLQLLHVLTLLQKHVLNWSLTDFMLHFRNATAHTYSFFIHQLHIQHAWYEYFNPLFEWLQKSMSFTVRQLIRISAFLLLCSLSESTGYFEYTINKIRTHVAKR